MRYSLLLASVLVIPASEAAFSLVRVWMKGVENLFDRMDRLAFLGPTFCDITWGAGGSTAELTLEIASKMQNMVNFSA